jgi:hypothetical protein
MLSQNLQRWFAALGARLHVFTQPKATRVRLCLRHDRHGPVFQLVLPMLSRSLVTLLALHPRRKRLLLRLGRGDCHTYVEVETHPRITLRKLKRRQVQLLMAGMPPRVGQEAA